MYILKLEDDMRKQNFYVVNTVDWFQHLFLPSGVLYCTKCGKLITMFLRLTCS